MLDPTSLRTLAEHPERNDPMLNVALAEEGGAAVLLSLAESAGVGSDAIAVIALRIEQEGDRVGYELLAETDDPAFELRERIRGTEAEPTTAAALDALLVVHPRANDAVRDGVLGRHAGDPFFTLAAAAHARATPMALEHLVRWPSRSAFHDRSWLGLVDRAALAPLVVATWAVDDDVLFRSAAACLVGDPAILQALARDGSREVRRGVASNPFAGELRAWLTTHDPACEVRARAASRLVSSTARESEPTRLRAGKVDVTSVRFRSAVVAMAQGGTVEADVASALRAGPLDPEGARIAGSALDDACVCALVGSVVLTDKVGLALAAGIAFREDRPREGATDADLVGIATRALAVQDRSGGIVTGKARLAAWLTDGVFAATPRAKEEMILAVGHASLFADRMVLGRLALQPAWKGEGWVRALCEAVLRKDALVPLSLLELAWKDAGIADETLHRLALRVQSVSREDASPESEVDLDPRARPLDVLERVGGALLARAPLSPRAALALVALEPRRIRYILSAMPQWKGSLAGVHVARVLRAHAGALSAAKRTLRPATTGPAKWTERRLDEVEIAIALAIGDLGPKDAQARLASGLGTLSHGTALAAGMEARAALEGVALLEPLVETLALARRQDAAALAAWLVVEGLDRPRSAAAIAAALDAPWAVLGKAPTRTGASGAPSSRTMVAPGIAEALAILERRTPGRLAEVMPQTPRGRATLVSGLARAYRALGGMSVEAI